jgi:hypothetical protein
MDLLNWSIPERQGHNGFGLPRDLPTFKINAHGRWLGEMIVAHIERFHGEISRLPSDCSRGRKST